MLTGLKDTIKKQYNNKFEYWLDKRIPRNDSFQLNRNSIFILPTKFAYWYIAICILIFILGTNYQNNLMLLICFLMISIFISSILFTYQNLSKLSVSAGHDKPIYANQLMQLKLDIDDGGKERFNLEFGFAEHPITHIQTTNNNEVTVTYRKSIRGWNEFPRVKILSTYPFGLCKCWTYLAFSQKRLAYPAPIVSSTNMTTSNGEQDNTQSTAVVGQDEYLGIRDYNRGDSLKRVSWKHSAKYTDKLVSKEFETLVGHSKWLSYDTVVGNKEERLSKLAHQILQAKNGEFGLILPDQKISISSGESHKKACLKALALC